VRQDYIDSYAAEARGGPAMIIVANTAVSKGGIAFRRLPRIDEDRFVPGLGDLAYAIHLADCKAAIQLFHGGIICRPDCLGGERPVAPSELPLPFVPGMRSRALSDGPFTGHAAIFQLSRCTGTEGVHVPATNRDT